MIFRFLPDVTLVCLCILLSIPHQQVESKILYASPIGSINETCGLTRENPCQGIDRALRAADAGSTIILLPGTFRLTNQTEIIANLSVEIRAETTNASGIVCDGKRDFALITISPGVSVTLDGLFIASCMFNDTMASAILADRVDILDIRNCWLANLRGVTSAGAVYGRGNSFLVANSTFHNNAFVTNRFFFLEGELMRSRSNVGDPMVLP